MVVTPKKTSPCDWPGGLPKAADRWTISLNVCSAGQRFSSIPIHRRGASGFLVCPAPDAPHRRAPRRRPGSHPQQQTQTVRNIMVFLHVCSARAFPRQSAEGRTRRFGPQPVTSGLLQATDIVWPPPLVRFVPEADVLHSITLSARARIEGGMVRPSALAVFRLMTSWYLEACSTGRSAGFAPLRILSM
jgi:hypothetical protein